jgi:hypothetical protein
LPKVPCEVASSNTGGILHGGPDGDFCYTEADGGTMVDCGLVVIP